MVLVWLGLFLKRIGSICNYEGERIAELAQGVCFMRLEAAERSCTEHKSWEQLEPSLPLVFLSANRGLCSGLHPLPQLLPVLSVGDVEGIFPT